MRALDALGSGPLDAGSVGAKLWGGATRGSVCASHGGGDYAAQMLLGRMRKAGLVRVCPGDGASRWELTARGRAALRKEGPDAK
jgi:hypothetical protein